MASGHNEVVPRRVLLVERRGELRELVGGSLRAAGYDVIEAESGVEAAKLLRRPPPDLIVLGLELPLAQGWGLIEATRELPEVPPAVVVGNPARFELFAEGVQRGVAAFVKEPIELGELLSVCERAIEDAEKGRAPLVEPERRRQTRRRLMVGVQLLDESGLAMALGELVDLSRGGFQVSLLARFPVGARVRVALDPSIAGTAMRFEGEVRWSEPAKAGFLYGLAFVAPTPDLEARIAALLGRS
jgi:DNA-binding response OmpR family regulator